jgi:hypothetical protein
VLDELLLDGLVELLLVELDDEEDTLADEPLAELLELDGCGGVGVTGGSVGLRFFRGCRRSCRRRFGFRSALAAFFCRLRFISGCSGGVSPPVVVDSHSAVMTAATGLIYSS